MIRVILGLLVCLSGFRLEAACLGLVDPPSANCRKQDTISYMHFPFFQPLVLVSLDGTGVSPGIRSLLDPEAHSLLKFFDELDVRHLDVKVRKAPVVRYGYLQVPFAFDLHYRFARRGRFLQWLTRKMPFGQKKMENVTFFQGSFGVLGYAKIRPESGEVADFELVRFDDSELLMQPIFRRWAYSRTPFTQDEVSGSFWRPEIAMMRFVRITAVPLLKQYITDHWFELRSALQDRGFVEFKQAPQL